MSVGFSGHACFVFPAVKLVFCDKLQGLVWLGGLGLYFERYLFWLTLVGQQRENLDLNTSFGVSLPN